MKRGNKIFVALLLCFCAFMMVGCGKEKEYFTITFYDEAGSLLEAKQVEEGVVPSMTYNKDDTQEWNYSFDGWSETIGGSVIQTLPAASVDKTYYAIVSQVKQQYTITFDSNDGTEITNITSDYNTSVECPENPTKEGYDAVEGYPQVRTIRDDFDYVGPQRLYEKAGFTQVASQDGQLIMRKTLQFCAKPSQYAKITPID